MSTKITKGQTGSRRGLIDILGNIPVASFVHPAVEVFLDIESYAITIEPLIDKKSKCSKWHKIKDGICPTSQTILLYNDETNVYATSWVGLTLLVQDKYTHWREMPKPPKKKGKK